MGLEGVRIAAKRDKKVRFTALLHHITPALLAQSFYALRRDAAPGVDEVTWQDYEEGLQERVQTLHRQIHVGGYRATPSRRLLIPKADGRQRALGIASLEDKIVQQAVVTVLNMIYEEDFLRNSHTHGERQSGCATQTTVCTDSRAKRLPEASLQPCKSAWQSLA